jgi:hypothetical protein
MFSNTCACDNVRSIIKPRPQKKKKKYLPAFNSPSCFCNPRLTDSEYTVETVYHLYRERKSNNHGHGASEWADETSSVRARITIFLFVYVRRAGGRRERGKTFGNRARFKRDVGGNQETRRTSDRFPSPRPTHKRNVVQRRSTHIAHDVQSNSEQIMVGGGNDVWRTLT